MPLTTDWTKSSYSESGTCVELQFASGKVRMRHSLAPAESEVVFTLEAWALVLANVRVANYAFGVGDTLFAPRDDGFSVTQGENQSVILFFTAGERRAFSVGVIAGEFDLPVGA